MNDTAQPLSDSIIEWSEHVEVVIAALVDARANFKPLIATESAQIKHDSGSYSYSYADLAGLLDATSPALQAKGLVPVQGWRVRGRSVTVETILFHASGEFIRHRGTLESASGTTQGIGSTISYARRYSLQAILCLAAKDDDGAAVTQSQEPPPRRERQQRAEAPKQDQNGDRPAPAGMTNAIGKLLETLELDAATVVGEMTENQKGAVADLTFAEGNVLLARLQKQKSEKSK